MLPSMVTHTQDFCSAFNPSKCTQQWVVNTTLSHTHTHREHTPRAVGGSVSCSRVSPQSWYWGWKRALVIHSPADTKTRTHDLQFTSLTLQPLSHNCPSSLISETDRILSVNKNFANITNQLLKYLLIKRYILWAHPKWQIIWMEFCIHY